jgi:hypothetical protein
VDCRTGSHQPPRWWCRLSWPHINQSDRDAIEDRGLVDNDRTEVLTASTVSGVGVPSEGPGRQ